MGIKCTSALIPQWRNKAPRDWLHRREEVLIQTALRRRKSQRETIFSWLFLTIKIHLVRIIKNRYRDTHSADGPEFPCEDLSDFGE